MINKSNLFSSTSAATEKDLSPTRRKLRQSGIIATVAAALVGCSDGARQDAPSPTAQDPARTSGPQGAIKTNMRHPARPIGYSVTVTSPGKDNSEVLFEAHPDSRLKEIALPSDYEGPIPSKDGASQETRDPRGTQDVLATDCTGWREGETVLVVTVGPESGDDAPAASAIKLIREGAECSIENPTSEDLRPPAHPALTTRESIGIGRTLV